MSNKVKLHKVQPNGGYYQTHILEGNDSPAKEDLVQIVDEYTKLGHNFSNLIRYTQYINSLAEDLISFSNMYVNGIPYDTSELRKSLQNAINDYHKLLRHEEINY